MYPTVVCQPKQATTSCFQTSFLFQPLHSCPSLRASQVTPAPTVVTAAADNAGKAVSSYCNTASSVKAAFTDAGLSKAAVDHIMTQYPAYLRWDVEQKLLPRLRRWQQELEDCFVSEIERIPNLLLKQPEEEQLKDQYLVSIGIKSPKTLRKRRPSVFRQSLTSLKSKVACLQQCGFTGAQTLSLIEQHSDVLSRSSQYVGEVLRVISDMFGCAQDKSALSDVLLSCQRRGTIFSVSPTALHHNFAYFCTCIGAKDKETQRAWKHGVFTSSPAELDIRLDSIAAQLDSTLDEAKSVARRIPEVCLLLPATVALHVMQLHDLGFTNHQVKSMCLRHPSMLTLNYNSPLQADKWAFLTCVLRLSPDAIAACPRLLMSSLPNRLGPRWAYLQQLRSHDVIAFTAASQLLTSLVFVTDTNFRAAYITPQLCVYDERFQKQWQRRWDFLLIDQQLSIQDIGDNPALLHTALKDI